MSKRNKKPFVIYADDNLDDVLLFKSAYQSAAPAFEMVTLSDGQQVIDYLEHMSESHENSEYPRPHLLVLDLKMPRKSGLDVLSWLRRHFESTKETAPQTLIFTSSQSEKDIRLAYERGCDWFLMKPVDYEELLELMNAISQLLLKKNSRLLLSFPGYRAAAA
jgi:DNA-binding response OmpR family regulator